MRKRWLWIGILVVVLFATLFVLSPRQPDGLDVIRKYRPLSETLVMRNVILPVPSTKGIDSVWIREFKFEKVPLELARELKEGGPPLSSTQINLVKLDDGSFVSWSDMHGNMSVQMAGEPPWLIRQWYALTQRFSSLKSP